MDSRLFVHTPAQLLPGRINFLLNHKLQPEVACQEVSINKLDLGQMRDCAEQLAALKLETTVHAPFNSFNPGSPKNRLQKTAHTMCQQSLQLAEILNASRIIFHPGIPYQASFKMQQTWLKHALNFWPDYISQAKQLNSVIAIENIYELHTDVFEQLFNELGNDHFGHCFDIGHWNIFAEQELEDWFAKLSHHMKHLHLHDNLADSDTHLPIGRGNVDFSTLFQLLKQYAVEPTMTLEAHKIADLEISLQQIPAYLDLLQ